MTPTVARVAHTLVVDQPALDDLLRPRSDAVVERADGPNRFVAVDGPFSSYERRLSYGAAVDGLITVDEVIEFRLAVPFWAWLFVLPYKRTLRRRHTHTPWWAPPDRLDARAATVLGLLCAMAIIGGYLGTLITQTITYARRDFGVNISAQNTTLAAVRAGSLLALVVVASADRRGRRVLLLGSAAAGCILTVTGAFAPNLVWLGISQTAARGMAGALLLLITIVSAEEMPRGTRAYAYSLITMTGALGGGMCLWALSIAGVDNVEGRWRILFVLPLAFLPLIWSVAGQLPESQRFKIAHADVPLAGHGRRFWLLASSLFLLAVFAAPASQNTNDFLRVERGFSAPRISLFLILTSTPGAIGIVAGGRIADVSGRRLVGAVGITGGTLLTVAGFLAHGWPLWAWSVLGSILAGLTVPVINVYRPELFPTSLRGKAAGLIEVVTVAGSAAGLLFTGWAADRWGSYVKPLAILAIPCLSVAVLMIVAFPETARRSLEDLNPEDAALASPASPATH